MHRAQPNCVLGGRVDISVFAHGPLLVYSTAHGIAAICKVFRLMISVHLDNAAIFIYPSWKFAMCAALAALQVPELAA